MRNGRKEGISCKVVADRTRYIFLRVHIEEKDDDSSTCSPQTRRVFFHFPQVGEHRLRFLYATTYESFKIETTRYAIHVSIVNSFRDRKTNAKEEESEREREIHDVVVGLVGKVKRQNLLAHKVKKFQAEKKTDKWRVSTKPTYLTQPPIFSNHVFHLALLLVNYIDKNAQVFTVVTSNIEKPCMFFKWLL